MPQAPPCAGTYETAHPTCNGDPSAATDSPDSAPCAWRERCRGLQIYCRENGHRPELVIATLPYAQLVALCEQYVTDHQIAQEPPRGPVAGPAMRLEAEPPPPPDGRPVPAQEPVAPRETPAARQRRRARAKPRRSRARGSANGTERSAPLDRFERALRGAFPERRFAAGNQVLVRPGTLYRTEQRAGSLSAAWYCVAGKGRDVALALVRGKQRQPLADVYLPVSVGELRAFLAPESFAGLSPRDFRKGQFASVCRNLDQERLALCAETLRGLADAEILLLPQKA